MNALLLSLRQLSMKAVTDPSRWQDLMDMACLLSNIDNAFSDSGLVAKAQLFRSIADRCYDEGCALAHQAECDANEHFLYHKRWLTYVRGCILKEDCNLKEADRYLKEALAITPEASRFNMYYILGNLAHAADLLENEDEAIAYEKRKCELLGDGYRFHYANLVSKKFGLTKEVEEIVERMGATITVYSACDEMTAKCMTLWRMGRKTQAVKEIDETISVAEQMEEYRRTLLDGLIVRAGFNCEMEHYGKAEADCLEVLRLCRDSAVRRFEIDAYEAYGNCLNGMKRYSDAIRVLETGFKLCESLGVYHRALRMLVGGLNVHIVCNDLAGARIVMNRIEGFIRVHPDLPDPTMLKYHLAKCDYAKSAGLENELSRECEEVKTFVEKSSLSKYEARDFWNYERKVAGNRRITNAGPQMAIVISPLKMVSQVATGEMARGRFLLCNPNSIVANGLLSLDGVSSAEWSHTNNTWTVSVTSDAGSGRVSQSMDIPPDNELQLIIEKEVSQVSTSMTQVGIGWQGAFSTNAVWAYGTAEKAFETAIVNASYERKNPFFCTTFYHEIYYRGSGSVIRNLKVQASSPVRIEIWDHDENRCLGIDANGNGDFGDKGDVLYQDTDKDMYADVNLSETSDTKAIALYVYPMGDESQDAEPAVDITLYMKEGAEWSPRAVDTLVMK